MSQIAQQDHLYFPVLDDSELTAEEKAGLLEKVKAGTILDTVLVTGKEQTKILAVADNTIVYFSNELGGLALVELE